MLAILKILTGREDHYQTVIHLIDTTKRKHDP